MWCKNCTKRIDVDSDSGYYYHKEPGNWLFTNQSSYLINRQVEKGYYWCTPVINKNLVPYPDPEGREVHEVSPIFKEYMGAINFRDQQVYNITEIFQSYSLNKLRMWALAHNRDIEISVKLIVDYTEVRLEVTVDLIELWVIIGQPTYFPKLDENILDFDKQFPFDQLLTSLGEELIT